MVLQDIRCNECGFVEEVHGYSYRGTTREHIRKKHSELYNELQEAEKELGKIKSKVFKLFH